MFCALIFFNAQETYGQVPPPPPPGGSELQGATWTGWGVPIEISEEGFTNILNGGFNIFGNGGLEWVLAQIAAGNLELTPAEWLILFEASKNLPDDNPDDDESPPADVCEAAVAAGVPPPAGCEDIPEFPISERLIVLLIIVLLFLFYKKYVKTNLIVNFQNTATHN